VCQCARDLRPCPRRQLCLCDRRGRLALGAAFPMGPREGESGERARERREYTNQPRTVCYEVSGAVGGAGGVRNETVGAVGVEERSRGATFEIMECASLRALSRRTVVCKGSSTTLSSVSSESLYRSSAEHPGFKYFFLPLTRQRQCRPPVLLESPRTLDRTTRGTNGTHSQLILHHRIIPRRCAQTEPIANCSYIIPLSHGQHIHTASTASL
jgi:hypothetical protein